MPQLTQSKLRTQQDREKARKDYLSGKTSIRDYIKLIMSNPPRYAAPSTRRIQVKKDKNGYLISVDGS